MPLIPLQYKYCPNQRYRHCTFNDATGAITGAFQDDVIDSEPCVNDGYLVHSSGGYFVRVQNAHPYFTVSQSPPNTCTVFLRNVEVYPDRHIRIRASIGSGRTLEYSYGSDAPEVPWQESNEFFNVPPGLWTAFVRDQDQPTCNRLKSFTIEGTELTAEVSSVNPSVYDGVDGTITINVLTGSGHYEIAIGAPGFVPDRIISLDSGASAQNTTVNTLPANTYPITITDLITEEVLEFEVVLTEPLPELVRGTLLEFPFMNSISMVKPQEIDDPDTKTFDNVLFKDQVFPGYECTNYFQKVCKRDAIVQQFYSDYPSHLIELYKYGEDESPDTLIKTFNPILREQNLHKTEDHGITIRNHTEVGQSRVYFNAGAPPIPLEVNDTFEVTNNADGFDGVYGIVDILNDVVLGYQYLVMNKPYTAPGALSEATGRFNSNTADFDVYEYSMNLLDVANGQYYVKVTAIDDFDNTDFGISEPIDLQVDHPHTNLIKYRNTDNAFGMTWTTGYVGIMRVESILFKRSPGGERTVSRDSDYSLNKTSAKKFRGATFETYMLPPYVHEKLSTAFDMDFWSINGMECQASEGYGEPQYIDRFKLANSSIKVEQKGWFDKYNSTGISSVNDGGFIATETGFIKR